MTDETGKTTETPKAATDATSSRRSVLKLGAVAVPAIATLSPSMAMATGGGGGAAISLMTCTVPMDATWYDEFGYPVPEGTVIKGEHGPKPFFHRDKQKIWVFRAPPGNAYSGQQLKDAFPGGFGGARIPPAGVDSMQFDAHVAYLTNVRSGHVAGAGLTCIVSLTNV